jgi:hypothetical protein
MNKIRRWPPVWDLYLVVDNKARLLVKNAEEKTLLNRYFVNLDKNFQKYPDITIEQLIESYKKLWNKQGELRCFYTDSWGHKWVCFPSDKKLTKYLIERKNEITNK